MRTRILVWTGVAAGLLVFTLANVHFVYVAVTTQPECVAHLKAPDPGAGAFRAATSSC